MTLFFCSYDNGKNRQIKTCTETVMTFYANLCKFIEVFVPVFCTNFASDSFHRGKNKRQLTQLMINFQNELASSRRRAPDVPRRSTDTFAQHDRKLLTKCISSFKWERQVLFLSCHTKPLAHNIGFLCSAPKSSFIMSVCHTSSMLHPTINLTIYRVLFYHVHTLVFQIT